MLAFALKGQEVAEYHYRFYHLLATLDGETRNEEMENRDWPHAARGTQRGGAR